MRAIHHQLWFSPPFLELWVGVEAYWAYGTDGIMIAVEIDIAALDCVPVFAVLTGDLLCLRIFL